MVDKLSRFSDHVATLWTPKKISFGSLRVEISVSEAYLWLLLAVKEITGIIERAVGRKPKLIRTNPSRMKLREDGMKVIFVET